MNYLALLFSTNSIYKLMKLLIADDHPLTLMGTKGFVESLGYSVSYTATNGITALNLAQAHLPDIAILDINMPGLNGIEILSKIATQRLPIRVILLTMHKELYIFKKANQLGLYGYLLKEFAHEELSLCLEQVKNGKQYISPRLTLELKTGGDSHASEGLTQLSVAEKKVMELIAEQKTSKQIADLLFISEKTVEKHRSNIIQKLDLPKEKNSLLMWSLQQLKT